MSVEDIRRLFIIQEYKIEAYVAASIDIYELYSTKTDLEKSLNLKEKPYREFLLDQTRVKIAPVEFPDFQLVNLIPLFLKN